MTHDDLEGVLEVVRVTPNAPLWLRAEYERILATDSSAVLYRVALVSQVGETIAGAGVVSLSQVERQAELEVIVVHPEFQRRGVGTALMRRFVECAGQAGAQAMRLEVRESNAAALALYRAQGFHEVGRRRSYYSAPVEDALLLVKRLSEKPLSP